MLKNNRGLFGLRFSTRLAEGNCCSGTEQIARRGVWSQSDKDDEKKGVNKEKEVKSGKEDRDRS